MNSSLKISRFFAVCAIFFGTSMAHATIVQFQTVKGDFEVNLYDEATPKTVANFLAYIESEAYNDSFFHRLVPGFVLQGGGFIYDMDEEEPKAVPSKGQVMNEPKFSNRRGTIAMAKGKTPNSATSQWFFNLKNNHTNLDVQNGGFTVFGEVVGDGMDVVDALAKLPRFAFGGAFGELPLRNYGDQEIEDKVSVTHEHLVMVHSIQVLDASPDTAADLEPVPNTLIHEVDEGGSSSSGSVGWLALLLLAFLGYGLRSKRS